MAVSPLTESTMAHGEVERDGERREVSDLEPPRRVDEATYIRGMGDISPSSRGGAKVGNFN